MNQFYLIEHVKAWINDLFVPAFAFLYLLETHKTDFF
jgi:hypothetical protein